LFYAVGWGLCRDGVSKDDNQDGEVDYVVIYVIENGNLIVLLSQNILIDFMIIIAAI
jgi:hypothetical protein